MISHSAAKLGRRTNRLLLSLLGVILAIVVGLVSPPPLLAQDARTIEATVLLRALSYDRNLKDRAGSLVVAAVVFNPGDKSSRAYSDKIYAAFSKLEKVKVQGLKFQAVLVPYEDSSNLKAVIERDGVDLVYVCPGLSSSLSKISEVSRGADILTAGASRKDVVAGLSLGVFERSNKRVILVNLAASKAEGASFGAQFLNLAEVIR